MVRTRRTAVGFDSGGTARLGGITRFSTTVNEFADLGRNPESVYVDGRIWSPATIFASVVQGLVVAEPATGVVATHPAGYTAKQLDLLRQSLDLAGVGHVQLVPEPVAAAHWLDTEHGPLDSGFVLVYDLGGNSLDVAVVRTGPDWPNHPVVGKPVRSYEFGARPLGALIARCAGDRAIGPAEPQTGAVSLVSFVDPEGLRREHVRDSLEVVRAAVRSAGVSLSDIGRVLVVGGAARPPQIAETLAELGLPVTVAADSGQCVALGAAAMAAESMTPVGSSRIKHPPIFSGAALFSAVAMSAATILGTGPADTELPKDRTPLQSPGAVLYEIHGEAQVERSGSGWTVSYAPLGAPALITPAAATRSYGPPMPAQSPAPARTETDRPAANRAGTHHAPFAEHSDSGPRHENPARFDPPIPFGHPGGGRPDRDNAEPGEPAGPGPEVPGGSPGPDRPPVVDGPGGTSPGGDEGSGDGPGGWSPGTGLPDIGVPGAGQDEGDGSGGGWTPPGSGGAGSGEGDGSGGGWTPPGGEIPGAGNTGPGGYGTGDSGGFGGGDSSGAGSGGDEGSGGTSSGGSGRSDSSASGRSGDSGGFGGFGGRPSGNGGSGGDSDSGGSSSGGSDSSGGSRSRSSDSGGSRSGDGGSSRGGSSRGGSSHGGSHR